MRLEAGKRTVTVTVYLQENDDEKLTAGKPIEKHDSKTDRKAGSKIALSPASGSASTSMPETIMNGHGNHIANLIQQVGN
jgi:hypothetical protein